MTEDREWVDSHEESVISDIRRLVSIGSVAELGRSVPPYGQACRDVMEEYCKIAGEHGYRCTSYDDRVIRVDTGRGAAVRISAFGTIWMWCRRDTTGNTSPTA